MSSNMPPDTRPYRSQSTEGTVLTIDRRPSQPAAHFRQVGWIGASGAFYSLDDEDPSQYERGSFSPLYIELGD